VNGKSRRAGGASGTRAGLALQSLRTAFAFLTSLPMGAGVRFDDEAIGRSVLWYPLVGLVLGSMLLAAAHLLPFDALTNGALIVLALILLTGALHLDGLADCADAWVGGLGDRDRTLAIMKDPRGGAMGSTAIAVVLILKTAAVTLALRQEAHILLVLAPVLGRMAALGLFATTPYVGTGAVGRAAAGLENAERWLVMLSWTAIGLLLLPIPALVWILSWTCALHYCLRRLMLRRLRGFTGDCAGALVEITEVTVLLVGSLVLP